MAWYLDTSALAKLVVPEPQSAALRDWASARAGALVGSELCRLELLRAVRRIDPDLAGRARVVIDALDLVPVQQETYRVAAALEPASLGTLDALHLACALELGGDLDGLVTYDVRLAEAATRLALEVVAPA